MLLLLLFIFLGLQFRERCAAVKLPEAGDVMLLLEPSLNVELTLRVKKEQMASALQDFQNEGKEWMEAFNLL